MSSHKIYKDSRFITLSDILNDIKSQTPTPEKVITHYRENGAKETFQEFMDRNNKELTEFISKLNNASERASELLKTDFCAVFDELIKYGFSKIPIQSFQDAGAHMFSIIKSEWCLSICGTVSETIYIQRLKELWPADYRLSFDKIQKYIRYIQKPLSDIQED